MAIILIRRCVRVDREAEFLARYNREKPTHPDFIDETLTKVDTSAGLPPALRSLALTCQAGITYINVARWKSVDGFIQTFGGHFNSPHDPDIECAPRERVVLNSVL